MVLIMNKVVVGSSRVTSRGQITIPIDIREKYGIKPRDTIYFVEGDGKLTLKKGPLKL